MNTRCNRLTVCCVHRVYTGTAVRRGIELSHKCFLPALIVNCRTSLRFPVITPFLVQPSNAMSSPLTGLGLEAKKSGLGLGIGGSGGLGLDLVLSGLVYFACFIHSQVMRPAGCNFLIPVTGNKVYANGVR